MTEVPDVVGLGAEDACEIVRRAGLVPFGPEGADAPTSGVVTGQRPVGAAGAEEGAPVYLWTNRGKDLAGDLVGPTPVESADLDPV
ncbi:hypothetical protein B0I33_10879 [Prauserella shujinwangii]|uniref:PASTA domain-containing protein n=1 Tax=Prauserella shujinwangii TaxID=1453103 RepID=A0A2T0LR52_9PSEU|nr:hypothetical protein B0I33_10879 [Prauserella shujinwangii]